MLELFFKYSSKIFLKFEMHEKASNRGIGNQSESASLLYAVKMNIWVEVCQQALDAISMNTQTNSPHGRTNHNATRPYMGCCS